MTESNDTSLTGRVSRGFAWMLLLTIGSKLFGFATQMVLARLLLPKDFGIMTMAYAAAAIPSMIRQTGIIQILVRKQSAFDRWVNAGFWMELALGTLAALLTIAVAPAACTFFHTQRLFGPLMIIASLAVLAALMTPPFARLTLDLRFRDMSTVGLGCNVFVMASSIGLAFLGCGVYSFFIPLPVAAILRAGLFWRMAPVRIKLDLQLHRWRPMFLDSMYLMGSGLFATILGQADNVALGRFVTATEVGYYSVASNLSSQMLQLLSINLSGVLFSALSSLKDSPPRQTAAFFRAARLLALIGIPLCVLESALAGPIIRLMYGQKFLGAVPLLRLLALSSGINLLFGPLQNFLQAQGRFGYLFKWLGLLVVVFVAVVSVAAWRSGALWVAGAVLGVAAAFQPAGMWLATRSRGGTWRQVAAVYMPPVLFSAASLTPAAILFLLGSPTPAIAVAGVGAFFPIYVVLARLLRRSDFAELRAVASRILRRHP